MRHVAAVAAETAEVCSAANTQPRPLKVLIAGAGIGGLVLAVALIKKGVDVLVFERDLTAIRGEGKYRGPIQVRVTAQEQQRPCCAISRFIGHLPSW